jgi:hypothetical protein
VKWRGGGVSGARAAGRAPRGARFRRWQGGARTAALAAGLHFVYLGNVHVPGGGDTICPHCRQTVVARQGYAILRYNIREGKCGECGNTIAGVWT